MNNPMLIKSKWAWWLVYAGLLLALGMLMTNQTFSVTEYNGFVLSDPLVPREQIFHGGPPRDGIPAIDQPRFVSAAEASFLEPEDRVLGLSHQGVPRAYPIKILNYHEIVNDRINDKPVVITYCPLCGSGMAFAPQFNADDVHFGVSGLLYNSDMLLYDRQTQSLWSQIMGMAITGEMRGTKLTTLVVHHTSWQDWLARHPGSTVLSTQTGHRRNYDQHPYGDYDRNGAIYFPINHRSARYHPKERVIGVSLGEQHKAYPVSELSRYGKSRFEDRLAGRTLTIEFEPRSQSAVVYDETNQPLPTIDLFWFAWYTFHPQTEVFQAPSRTE